MRIRAILSAFVLALAAFLVGCAPCPQAADYMPLDAGRSYIYNFVPKMNTEMIQKVKVEYEKATFNGKECTVLKHFSKVPMLRQHHFYGIEEDQVVSYGSEMFKGLPNEMKLTFNPPAVILQPFPSPNSAWISQGEVSIAGRTSEYKAESVVLGYNIITVPAGEFECVGIQTTVEVLNSMNVTETVWLAEGIGMIKSENDFGVFELESYSK